MISIAFIKNPFDTDRKEIYSVSHVSGQTVQKYVESYLSYYPDTEFHISINGHILEKYEIVLVCPADGDQLVILPVVGKNLSSLLNGIAMMALTAGVSGLHLGLSHFMTALVKGTMIYVGGRIINAILPLPKQNLSSSTTSATYGWDGAKSVAATGTPVGKTFGTVSPALVILAKHITSDGDKQYLNILYGGGEGPVDSVDNITIDGNPIANYSNVQVDIRLGTNDQEPIANFGDTFADQTLNYELQEYSSWVGSTELEPKKYALDAKIEVNDALYNCSTAGTAGMKQPAWPTSGTVTDGTVVWTYAGSKWATQQTEGNAGEGLEIVIEMPYGLYYTKDSGSLANATVKVKAQYRKVGATDWTDWALLKSGVITAKKNTTVRRVYRIDNLDPAQYEVRCQCYYKSGTSTRYSTRVYWTQLSHIIYNDFARPNKVLIGIKALATDQLSGSEPTVCCTQTRSKVNVWNPYTNQYEQKPATNPYWACYDLIHNCKYLKNINTGQYEYLVEGNPVSRIDYPSFSENAAYSAELDSDGDPRFELNLYIDTEISFQDALARIAVVGRGIVLPRGTKYSCICDKPAVPTQIFTMGNITEKSLKGKFQSIKDRSQCIEVDFFNKEKSYKQDIAVYFGDEFNTTTQVPNPTKVTRYGITKYKYAYRDAIFLYKGNKYLKRTQNWEADIDAIACRPGDVVLLQHNVPKWGAAGGRIVSATENTVTLDQEITLLPGKTYAVEIRLKTDSRVNRVVTAVGQETITRMLNLTVPFADIPERYDVFAFGETSKVTKPFKVTNIVKSKDLQCKLTGVEYIEGMYSDVVDIPVVNYSSYDNALVEVENLSVGQETYIQKDGTTVSIIHCSWVVPRDKKIQNVIISYSNDDGIAWTIWDDTVDNSAAITGLKALETYLVKICTVNESGITSTGVISNAIYITGKDDAPSDVTVFNATQDVNDQTKIILSWKPISDADLKQYIIRLGGDSWDTAPTTVTESAVGDTYTYTQIESGVKLDFWIKAVDFSLNKSSNAAFTTITPAIATFTQQIQSNFGSYTQISPSKTWTITHNLGRYPSVTIVDSGGSVVMGDVGYITNNQLKVTFTSAFSGKAYLN